MQTEEEFIKEHSYEAQDAFLQDLFTVCLHGQLPGETQKKLFAAAAGMQGRCNKARAHIETRLKSLQEKGDPADIQAILELQALMRFLS